MLAALRHDQRLADLAGGNHVSRSTVDRWLREMIELLAARAARLERVLAKIAREGGSVVLLDGSLIPTQRRTGIPMGRRWSAKHKRHGLLVIALTDVQGRLLWTSTVRPARGSEITACRHDDLVDRLREAGLAAIATSASSAWTTTPATPLTDDTEIAWNAGEVQRSRSARRTPFPSPPAGRDARCPSPRPARLREGGSCQHPHGMGDLGSSVRIEAWHGAPAAPRVCPESLGERMT
ncbi:hypothetical protein [Streptomyces sp. NPDC002133]|uniref:hypothetical protein n=1 Tax=Streptomyces sp. NPDC002133 TaxID=3154409 RepID=UPI0033210662